VISEGREEKEKEKEKEKGNSEKDRITRGYGYCVAKRSLIPGRSGRWQWAMCPSFWG